jgi:hypothetical protein
MGAAPYKKREEENVSDEKPHVLFPSMGFLLNYLGKVLSHKLVLLLYIDFMEL